jgi:hypothetical protein
VYRFQDQKPPIARWAHVAPEVANNKQCVAGMTPSNQPRESVEPSLSLVHKWESVCALETKQRAPLLIAEAVRFHSKVVKQPCGEEPWLQVARVGSPHSCLLREHHADDVPCTTFTQRAGDV